MAGLPAVTSLFPPLGEEVTQKAKNDPRLTQSEPLGGHIQERLKAWRVARTERLSAARDYLLLAGKRREQQGGGWQSDSGHIYTIRRKVRGFRWNTEQRVST